MVRNISLFSVFLLFAVVKATSIFFTDVGVTAVIETSPTYCQVHTARPVIKFIIKFHADIVYVNDTTLAEYKTICEQSQKGPKNGTFIYPGTLWCGPGFRARSYDDLGLHFKEDSCCREHDHCKKFIAAGSCKENLCNISPFTRSHCECDIKFKKCLQDANTDTANTIGAIFFNIAKLICYQEDSNCQVTESNRTGNATCGQYRYVSAGRYSPTMQPRFRYFGKKEHFINILFRKIGLL